MNEAKRNKEVEKELSDLSVTVAILKSSASRNDEDLRHRIERIGDDVRIIKKMLKM